MAVGNKRFRAKSVQRIVRNFCRWRDMTISGINTIGTHWEVRSGGKQFGEIVFDGTFRPLNSPGRPPWNIVDDLLAEHFKTDHEHSREYMAGVRAALEWRLMRSPMGCPFSAGSVEADAFVAGREKGTKIEVTLGS